MKKADLLVGVDVGGTFTDVFVFDTINGNFFTTKVPSTIRDQSLGFIEGVAKIVPDFSVILNIVHGSTVGTNALLEKRGAKTGIITTLGFADILEMRRRDRPKTWGLKGDSHQTYCYFPYPLQVCESLGMAKSNLALRHGCIFRECSYFI